MPPQDLASIITKAKSGQLDPLTAMIEALARDLRAFIATYAASRTMVEEVHTATWIQVRKDLGSCPPNSQCITWVRQRAIGMLRIQLEAERSAAIAARDGLRHLMAQDGAEGLQALVSPNNEGAALLNQRYTALDEATQMLISRRYADGASLSELAGEMGVHDGEIAKRLFAARAGLHWRNTDVDRRPLDDPHLAIAIDQLLAETLDATGRQNLGVTLMKDLGRAAAFTRQARIDLMLHAVFSEYTAAQARQLATTLAKIEHQRRNESSLLQVAAPPRTPVGSGTELRMANDRIADRQTGAPSSATAVISARPLPRAGAAPRRRGGNDENMLSRERPHRGKNRQTLLIGGAVAAVAVIALMVMLNRGGGTIQIDGAGKAGGHIATTSSAQSGAQTQLEQRGETPTDTKSRPLKPTSFVRGINLGGAQVTIDRKRWLSHREALSAGFSLNPGTSIAPPAMFSGARLDFDRKTMLDSGLVGNGGPVQFTQMLPDGAYDLTLWLANTATLEASHLGLTVNDQSVPLANALQKRDTWAQLGPLPVRATKGRIEVSIGGHGSARIAGMTLEAPDGDALALPAAVTITSPIDAASFYSSDKITIRAEVVGKVRGVRFFSGDKLLGEALKEPYAVTVDKLDAGDHRIVAKALNLSGEPSESLPQSFTVTQTFGSGTILIQRWTGLSGGNFNDIKGKAKVEGPPQQSSESTSFATPTDWGDHYYGRLRGYVHPPITGEYVFWMTSDDEGELLLSTSDDPAQARRIASSASSTGSREWTKQASQKSTAIPLVAGQKYYIELRYKEHEGNDFAACGWKLPNGQMDRPIDGPHLSPFKP